MLLRTQDRILLALAFLGDLFEDLAGAGGIMSFSYKTIYGFVPRKYKKHNFLCAVSYALKTGKIEKIIKNGEVYLRLTGRGKKKLIRDFPFIWFQRGGWDGFWRVLPYDIREAKRKQRDRLRRKLYELGFRQFQKSVYICPFPIEEEMRDFLEALRLGGKAHVLLCREILGVENRKLAERLWRLEKLNQKYKALLEKIKRASDEEEQREVKAKYLDLLSEDPFLPKELLPRPWWREQLEEEMRKLLKK